MTSSTRLPLLATFLVAGSLIISACDAGTPVPPTATTAAAPTSVSRITPEATREPTEPAVEPTAEPTQEPSPTSFINGTPTPAPTVAPDDLSRDLERFLVPQLPPTPTPDSGGTSFGGLEGIHAFKIGDGTTPLYAAHSTGLRNFDPQQNHFLGVYERRGDSWEELARIEIDEPDILDETSARPADFDDESAWVELSGSAGAHGGTYHIFRYAGGKLEELVNFSNTIPAVGALEDITGDGTPEVVLNETDAYVFCYACGVRYVDYSVLRWDGSRMEPVELTMSASIGASGDNDRAVKLAQGELWKDALTTIEKARQAAPDNDTIAWNTALIKLIAEGREDHTVDNSYPLLPRIFYGDYDAAVAGIRDFSPEELFHPQTPLIKGTTAEGWEEALYAAIERTTGKAIEADPQRAGAYFFRGWARWRVTPESQEAVADLKRAAELAPNEELFGFVAAYVTNE